MKEYSKLFEEQYEELYENEKGLSSSKFDNANIDGTVHTIWGVTKRYYPEEFQEILDAHNSGNIILRDYLIKKFYFENYWSNHYENIESKQLIYLLFNYSVMSGKINAGRLMQRTLKYFYHKKIKIDGKVGRNSVKAINNIKLEGRLEACFTFFIGFDCLLKQYLGTIRNTIWRLIILSERDNDKKNIVGWLYRYYKPTSFNRVVK